MTHKKFSAEEMRIAHEFIKNVIRSESIIPFHKDELYEPFSPVLREQLRGPTSSDERLREIIQAASREVETECPGLEVRLSDKLHGINLGVTGETEWADAIQYAHGGGKEEANHKLSPVAASLLERVEKGELTKDFRTELSVRHRIRLFGYDSRFETILEEIRAKKGIEIKMDQHGDKWYPRKHFLKFTIISRCDPTTPPQGYNPVLPEFGGRAPTRREFQRWFSAMLADTSFIGHEPILVWSIHSRREFHQCFPESVFGEGVQQDLIVPLLHSLRSNPNFNIGWNLDNHSCSWFVKVGPVGTWDETRVALKAELAKPTTESRYSLSSPAALLFDWVNSLAGAQLEHGLTPDIGKEIRENRLLLECPWSRENLRLYLDLLCEEISERTPLDLRVVDWHEGSSVLSRIRVKKRVTPG